MDGADWLVGSSGMCRVRLENGQHNVVWRSLMTRFGPEFQDQRSGGGDVAGECEAAPVRLLVEVLMFPKLINAWSAMRLPKICQMVLLIGILFLSRASFKVVPRQINQHSAWSKLTRSFGSLAEFP